MADKKTNISLEDLLSLKKQERPEQSFWDNFDRELKEKTLQAAVRKPSFISSVIDAVRAHARPLIPASAVALFTLSLFVYSPSSSSSDETLFASHSSPISVEPSQTHLLQNTIHTDSPSPRNFTNIQVSPSFFSGGVHYLAGSVATIGLESAIQSNTLY